METLPSEFYLFLAVFYGFILLIAVFYLYAFSRLFRKAGQPAWTAWVPIYNMVIYSRITGKPDWWALLHFVPIANIVVNIMCSLSLAERFKKDVAFGIGLILLPYVFVPILAFGDAVYLQEPPRSAGLDNVLDAQ